MTTHPALLCQVLHFLQEYGQAIESYQQAAALDPSLPAADTADTARRQAQTLSSAVSKRVSLRAGGKWAAPVSLARR